MVSLYKAGETHLRGLIEAGKYNTDQAWSWDDSADGDKLLGDKGDNWGRYGSVHLGEDDQEPFTTKGHWRYPAAKATGDTEEVYRRGLIAAKQRASAQKDRDVESAAGRLIDLIDAKEGDKNPAGDKPKAAAAPLVGIALRELPRLASRVFDTPLLVARGKLDIIMGVIGPRLRLADLIQAAVTAAPQFAAHVSAAATASGDDGDNSDPDAAPDPSGPYDLSPDGIATIPIGGTLVHRSGFIGALSGLTGYPALAALVGAAAQDPKVKGVLFVVDSLGGECSGLFDLADAISALGKAKPVYCAVDDYACSAAYMLASSASQIFVTRTGCVGSIGVVALHVDQSAKDAAEGMRYEYVYAGDRKVDFDPHSPLSDPARASLQAEINRIYDMFVGAVALRRNMTTDSVKATQASLFFGEQAVVAGLADAVGTPSDALAALTAKIAEAPALIGAAPDMPADPTIDPGKTPGAATAATAEIIDLAAHRETAVVEAIASHTEIVDLCTLAGAPNLAADFIRRRLSVEDARTELQKKRAQASDARRTAGHIMPDAGITTDSAVNGWDKAFADAQGRKGK